MNKYISRGDIYYSYLGENFGHEQGGVRPVLIIQNNLGNLHSPTVIVAPITSRIKNTTLPTHVYISERAKLDKNSVILLEQIRTIDKSRLKEYLCRLQSDEMESVNKAISISLGV